MTPEIQQMLLQAQQAAEAAAQQAKFFGYTTYAAIICCAVSSIVIVVMLMLIYTKLASLQEHLRMSAQAQQLRSSLESRSQSAEAHRPLNFRSKHDDSPYMPRA